MPNRARSVNAISSGNRKSARSVAEPAPAAMSPLAVAESSRAPAVTFGARLRALRERNKWTLAKVSQVSGVPGATLSRIENDKVSPTFDVMLRIVSGFGMSLSDFMLPQGRPPGERTVSISRRGQGSIVEMQNVIYHPLHLSNVPNFLNSAMVTVFARRPEEYGPLVAHSGQEFVHVLEGTLEVLFEDGTSHTLEHGDSLHFHSDIRHGYLAKGPRQAKCLVVWSSPTAEFDFHSRE